MGLQFVPLMLNLRVGIEIVKDLLIARRSQFCPLKAFLVPHQFGDVPQLDTQSKRERSTHALTSSLQYF